MKLYVASNYQHDRDQVALIATVLEKAGHTITFKWWENAMSKARKAMYDLNGVASAEALVVYMEHSRNYRGTWVEVGIALGRGIPVYFIGDWNRDLIFRTMCHDFYTRFPDADVIREIKEALA